MPIETVHSRYPAKYSDARGSEETVITNDSDTLRMRVRGVEFAGPSFDCLSPAKDTSAEQLRQFTLALDWLCSCQIECQIPVPIGGRIKTDGILLTNLALSDLTRKDAVDPGTLRLVLQFDGLSFSSSGAGGFGDELLEIQSQLPEDVYIKACINCLYSDYSPYGQGDFGDMMCFRNQKSEYVKVRGKHQLWSLPLREDRMVQETYLCPEFERRVPGTGYRG